MANPGQEREALLGRLADQESFYLHRRDAAAALGALGDREAVPHLVAALRDPEASVGREAARALAQLGDPQAVTGLAAVLGAPGDEYLRREVAESLARFAVPEARPSLAAAAQDAVLGVRWAAEAALRQLDAALAERAAPTTTAAPAAPPAAKSPPTSPLSPPTRPAAPLEPFGIPARGAAAPRPRGVSPTATARPERPLAGAGRDAPEFVPGLAVPPQLWVEVDTALGAGAGSPMPAAPEPRRVTPRPAAGAGTPGSARAGGSSTEGGSAVVGTVAFLVLFGLPILLINVLGSNRTTSYTSGRSYSSPRTMPRPPRAPRPPQRAVPRVPTWLPGRSLEVRLAGGVPAAVMDLRWRREQTPVGQPGVNVELRLRPTSNRPATLAASDVLLADSAGETTAALDAPGPALGREGGFQLVTLRYPLAAGRQPARLLLPGGAPLLAFQPGDEARPVPSRALLAVESARRLAAGQSGASLRPAAVAYRRALAAAPGWFSVRHDLAHIYYRMGRHVDGLREVERAIRAEPFNAHYLNCAAWTLATAPPPIRDGARALPLARRAVQLAPDHWEIVHTLAEAYFVMGDRKHALEVLGRAEKLAPSQTRLKQDRLRYSGESPAASEATSVPGTAGSVPRDNLLTNGDFELGPPVAEWKTLPRGSQELTGWSITRGTVDYNGRFAAAADGTRCVDLDGSPGFGALEQSFPTTPGREYEVSLSLAGNTGAPPRVKVLVLSAAGQSARFSFDTAGRSLRSPGWRTVTWRFTGNAPRTSLELSSGDQEGGYAGPLVDAVSVTEVSPGPGGAPASGSL